MIKLDNEEQLLDQNYRAQAIKFFESEKNVNRKVQSKERYDIYFDKIREKVLDNFKKEMLHGVNEAVINRIANINICRKIIEKKALVYKDGVVREVDQKIQSALDAIVDILNLNSLMALTNKYVELDNNTLLGILPYLNQIEDAYQLIAKVYPAYQYDVIVDARIETMPRAFIFSCLSEEKILYASVGEAGVHPNENVKEGSRYSEDHKEYVWWSTSYHFTTDKNGEVIQGEEKGDGVNPIEEIPFVPFSKQEGNCFWKEGGDDIINYTILINTLLTDLYYIAKFQGMGVFYLFGKGVPKSIDIGPSSCITVDVEEGEPTPQIGFASSNPPIADHLSMIQSSLNYLMLSNNLDPGSMEGLNSTQSAQSGIQEIIQKAENMTDIEAQREMYRDQEPKVFEIIFKWINYFKEMGRLSEEYADVPSIDYENVNLTIKFKNPQPYLSEKEKLDIIQQRMDMGLDTMADAIKLDNPDLTEEEINAKEQKMQEEKRQKMKQVIGQPMMDEEDDEDADKPQGSQSDDSNQEA